VVELLRPPAADADPYDTTSSDWTVEATGVLANLQPLTGSVQQAAAGREVEANWKGFLEASAAVEENWGVRITEGVGPRRYRVRQVGVQGAPWDIEVLLAATVEKFSDTDPD
jgi:hypothetical protein